jgi:hypothetical protein
MANTPKFVENSKVPPLIEKLIEQIREHGSLINSLPPEMQKHLIFQALVVASAKGTPQRAAWDAMIAAMDEEFVEFKRLGLMAQDMQPGKTVN